MVQWAKDLIHNDPKRASELFEIPYERLVGIGSKKNYTLQEIGDNYFNKVEFQGQLTDSQRKELSKIRSSWQRFLGVVKVKTIREVNKAVLKRFYDSLYKEYRKEVRSTTWMKGYCDRAKRVINAAIGDLDHPEDIIEVRRLCLKILKPPGKIVRHPPYRIKKAEFHRLLEHSNSEEKAMWLLSLNGAYYSIDTATVPFSAFDWDAKTVVFSRGKMEARGGGKRAALLWDETIEALQKYIEENEKRERTTLFVSCYGEPYAENRIRKKFNQVREKAGLQHIRHCNFRDSFASVAHRVKGIQNSLDAVMGQNPEGSRGDYIDPELTPEIAEDACKVVHDYYFG